MSAKTPQKEQQADFSKNPLNNPATEEDESAPRPRPVQQERPETTEATTDTSPQHVVTPPPAAEEHTNQPQHQQQQNKVKEPLFQYRTDVYEGWETIPYEAVDEAEGEVQFYNIALELAGVRFSSDITANCLKTLTGYDLSISADKRSAFKSVAAAAPPPPPPPPEAHAASETEQHNQQKKNGSTLSNRKLGKLEWKAHVTGVFEGAPQMALVDGVLKIRIKKRTHKNEAFVLVDF